MTLQVPSQPISFCNLSPEKNILAEQQPASGNVPFDCVPIALAQCLFASLPSTRRGKREGRKLYVLNVRRDEAIDTESVPFFFGVWSVLSRADTAVRSKCNLGAPCRVLQEHNKLLMWLRSKKTHIYAGGQLSILYTKLVRLASLSSI